ncbi:MAG: peptide chain release factor N(5)-glutamine methyltransferase [candidate division NC10 bacterium]|nr:peptide chain release factor N(5)-glutamine methyltransferase [candidate division NC10 bacterium]
MDTLLREAAGALRAAGVKTPRLDAECLLAAALGCDRAALYGRRGGVPLEAASGFATLLGRRAAAEPVAYLTGTREFWSLPLKVTPAVLIPRPETETLVEAILDCLAESASRPLTVADVGTGCGAIAIALAVELREARVFAVDVSPEALAVAVENARRFGVDRRITFLQGNWTAPLFAAGLAGRLHALVANPPYIPTAELGALDPEIVRFEPRLALDGGPDGLACHRELAASAPRLLRPGGWLALEVGAGQGEAVGALLAAVPGLAVHPVVRDLARRDRVCLARRHVAAG